MHQRNDSVWQIWQDMPCWALLAYFLGLASVEVAQGAITGVGPNRSADL